MVLIRLPSLSRISPPDGVPSSAWLPPKRCRTVSLPAVFSLNTTPQPKLPVRSPPAPVRPQRLPTEFWMTLPGPTTVLRVFEDMDDAECNRWGHIRRCILRNSKCLHNENGRDDQWKGTLYDDL